MAYRAANQTGAVRRESTSEKKDDPVWPEKSRYCMYTVRSGEGGDEEWLLPDAVSERRCRRAEEIPVRVTNY